jgi:ABC-2 type transport system permease protein
VDKIMTVARREFLATVRTKAFVLSVLLMPGIIIAGIFGTEWVQKLGRAEVLKAKRIALQDPTGRFLPAFEGQIAYFNKEQPNQPLELETAAAGASQAELDAQVRTGKNYAYIIADPNIFELDGPGCQIGRADNQLETGERLERMINNAVFNVRCGAAGIDPAQIVELRRDVPVTWTDVQTGKSVAANPIANFMMPFAFMFLLFMGTFGISQGLLTSLIEEKSSRVVEVLLSAISPTQLLAGKILGMVTVGFVLMAVWGGVGFACAQRFHVQELVSGYRMLIALLYFVPGFLLFASLLGAVGSACNDLKDAQSMTFPLSLLNIIPMIFWFYLAEHPDSFYSVLLSYVPPITPLVMVLRVCADPHTPLWQIVSTLALLWVSVIVALWAAAKVFRVGVLMYGKAPSLKELAHWVRYS